MTPLQRNEIGTVLNMRDAVSKHGDWNVRDVKVEVMIIDVRKTFDRTDYRIMPVRGSGDRWVAADTVTGLRWPEGAKP